MDISISRVIVVPLDSTRRERVRAILRPSVILYYILEVENRRGISYSDYILTANIAKEGRPYHSKREREYILYGSLLSLQRDSLMRMRFLRLCLFCRQGSKVIGLYG